MVTAGLVVMATVLGLFVFVAVARSLNYWAARTGIPTYPATRAEKDAVIELLRLGNPTDGTIYELGCGFGALAREIARAFPHMRVEALEISPLVAKVARIARWRHSNLCVRCVDFMSEELEDATSVVCYLMIKAMPPLATKLDRELRAGTPVVSIVFRFRDRQVSEGRPQSDPDVLLYHWPATARGLFD